MKIKKAILIVILGTFFISILGCGKEKFKLEGYYDEAKNITNEALFQYGVSNGDCYKYLERKLIDIVYQDFSYEYFDAKFEELLNREIYGKYYSLFEYLSDKEKNKLNQKFLDELRNYGIEASGAYTKEVRDFYAFLMAQENTSFQIEIYDPYVATYYRNNIQKRFPSISNLEVYKRIDNYLFAKITFQGRSYEIERIGFANSSFSEINYSKIMVEEYIDCLVKTNYKSISEKEAKRLLKQNAYYVGIYGENDFLLLKCGKKNRSELVQKNIIEHKMKEFIQYSYLNNFDKIYEAAVKFQKEYYSLDYSSLLLYLTSKKGTPVSSFLTSFNAITDQEKVIEEIQDFIDYIRNHYQTKEDFSRLKTIFDSSSLYVFSCLKERGFMVLIEENKKVTNGEKDENLSGFNERVDELVGSIKPNNFYVDDTFIVTEYGLQLLAVNQLTRGNAIYLTEGEFYNKSNIVNRNQVVAYFENKTKGEMTPEVIDIFLSPLYEQYFKSDSLYLLIMQMIKLDKNIDLFKRKALNYEENSLYESWYE